MALWEMVGLDASHKMAVGQNTCQLLSYCECAAWFWGSDEGTYSTDESGGGQGRDDDVVLPGCVARVVAVELLAFGANMSESSTEEVDVGWCERTGGTI